MTTRQDFTPEEWAKIAESVMVASVAVTAADPSGLWGSLKESFAGASFLVSAKTNASASELIKSVVAHFESSEGRTATRDTLKQRFSGVAPAQITQQGIAALEEVAGILDRKAPGESAAFKQWLYAVSQKVADASKEGGFLGFGGVRVSDAEKATLDQIKGALELA